LAAVEKLKKQKQICTLLSPDEIHQLQGQANLLGRNGNERDGLRLEERHRYSR
jgi:hypothetical protein